LPFSLDIAPIVVFFLYVASKVEKISSIHTPILLMVFIASYIANLYLEGRIGTLTVNMCQSTFGNYGLFLTTAITGSVLCIKLSKRFKSTPFVAFIGENTLIVYGLHNIFKDIYPILLVKGLSLANITLYDGFVQFLMGVFILVLILVSFIPIINLIKGYLPFMIGKSRLVTQVK